MNAKRYLAVGLIVSIALNLVLVGFLAGRGGGGRATAFDPALSLMRLVRFLPEERRAELSVPGDLRRELGRAHRQMREGQARIRDALVQVPFDRAALDAALADFQQHFHASQVRSHTAFADIAARLTDAERREFVDNVRPRGRERRGDRGPPGRRPRPTSD